MPSTRALFGVDSNGHDFVDLVTPKNRARCYIASLYRDPPWTLTTAHGLGFGTQRHGGLIQHFDDPESVGGYWVPTHKRRTRWASSGSERPAASPDYFDSLDRNDSITLTSSILRKHKTSLSLRALLPI